MHYRLLPNTIFLCVIWTLLSSSSLYAGDFSWHKDSNDDPWAYFTNETPDQTVIRIRGRILETHSGKPLKKATVMIKSGDKIIATRLTSIDGFFSVDIPRDLSLKETLDMSVEFMDHVFLKQNLSTSSQDILVNINGEILLDDDPIADYKLPIHVLNNPKVGNVEIRLRQLKAKALPGSSSDEV